MNVNLLRRVQLSIADLNIPFDMGCWERCIAGHACAVYNQNRILGRIEDPRRDVGVELAGILGITMSQRMSLFGWGGDAWERYNREYAIAKISRLIADYEAAQAASQPTPEPSDQPAPAPEPLEEVCV